MLGSLVRERQMKDSLADYCATMTYVDMSEEGCVDIYSYHFLSTHRRLTHKEHTLYSVRNTRMEYNLE